MDVFQAMDTFKVLKHYIDNSCRAHLVFSYATCTNLSVNYTKEESGRKTWQVTVVNSACHQCTGLAINILVLKWGPTALLDKQYVHIYYNFLNVLSATINVQ